MDNLYDWLITQHSGLKTFKTFLQMAQQLASSDVEHRALYYLLIDIAERHIAKFQGEPVPVDVAENAYRNMLDIVADAKSSIGASAAARVEILNRIATAKL